ncbi:hypothetical protein [Cellvibrio sp. pealriver]|uniref:hypothetical protein n=1 Tax=Cellvibrio sp. pealriver TaxID=1622269 RepID=UPI000A917911|nr:hypothetical protein [Cellvibrio sp. pealriver]
MKKLLPAIGLLLCVNFLSGCGSETVAADDPHENYVPELRAFDIIDSYDTDTATPNHPPLILDPYLYDGLFEVFWDVDSLEDYRVSVRINDRNTIENSIVVHSQWCGAGRSCDQSGNLICEYTSDFFMSCGNAAQERDIYPLIDQIPQKVYLFIEICDYNSGYCEYDYYPVELH